MMVDINKKCIPCSGSGRMMGGGMIYKDCDHCAGLGKMIDDDPEYSHLKTTNGYKDAITKIKSVHSDVSDDEAEEIFKKELYKIREEEKPKKKRKK